MIPKIGIIVEYTLNENDANEINYRRDSSKGFRGNGGFQLHIGNVVSAGDKFPMLIVRTWGDTPEAQVNGKVFLDGNDDHWVTSVAQGDAERQWREVNVPAEV